MWGNLALLIGSFFGGAISGILVLWWWMTSIDAEDTMKPPRKLSVMSEFTLPKELSDAIFNQIEGYQRRETCFALNLLFQFFFQEKQYEQDILSWLTNMLNLEFAEMLKQRTLSKLIDGMKIRHLDLGANFLIIKAVTAKHVDLNVSPSRLDRIELVVEVEYNGGFQLAIDASSRWAKSAMVKIKVVHLSGTSRLQFSRDPFTHWSFSFYEEPEVQFEVDSSVLGRHIPRFTSIIMSQLKGVLKRKHTLPYYKLRGPPLIKRTLKIPPLEVQNSITESSNLTLEIVRCSRLQTSLIGSSVYCSVMLSDVPLVCLVDKNGFCILRDLMLQRSPSQPIGILLRDNDDNLQVVESVNPNSPAQTAGLLKDDIIVSINGSRVSSAVQAAKLFSTGRNERKCFSVRIQRSSFCDDGKVSTTFSSSVNANSDSQDEGSLALNVTPASSSFDVVRNDTVSHVSSLDAVATTWSLSSPPVSEIRDGVASVALKSSMASDRSVFYNYSRSRATPVLSPNSISVTESHICSTINSHPSADSLLSSEKTVSVSSLSSRAVTPSQLLAGFMGSLAGSRHAKSLPGSPVLQRKFRANYDGPQNPSTSATPDSSRANSPELKRKFMEYVPTDCKNSNEKCVNKSEEPNNDSKMVISAVPTSARGEKSIASDILSLQLDSKLKKNGNVKYVCKVYNTPLVEGNGQDPIFGSLFEFDIIEKCPYLHISVWSRGVKVEKVPDESKVDEMKLENSSQLKEEVENKIKKESGTKDMKDKTKCRIMNTSGDSLVGYLNLPLALLVRDSTLNTQGHIMKILNLEPPDPTCPEVSNHPLMSHRGFDAALCYGDVTLSVTCFRGKKSGLSKMKETEDDLAVESVEEDLCVVRSHDFKRTQFSAATVCAFCRKKIWLKDAYQCGECGITCHKKCMGRCSQETVCQTSGLTFRKLTHDTPEIVTTGVGETEKNEIPTEPPLPSPQRRTLSNLLAHVTNAGKGSIKRAGSAQNLALPTHDLDTGTSRSLPPSPQHSPQHSPQISRKGSLTAHNPFFGDCGTDGVVEAALERLLFLPHDEHMMTLARESAKELLAHLPQNERQIKINHMLVEVQSAIDKEGEIRVELARQEKLAVDTKDALALTKLAFMISQCDARMQALALLTLHCCTALQHCDQSEADNNAQ